MTVIIYATDPLGEFKHVNAYDGQAKLERKPKQQTQARKNLQKTPTVEQL